MEGARWQMWSFRRNSQQKLEIRFSERRARESESKSETGSSKGCARTDHIIGRTTGDNVA